MVRDASRSMNNGDINIKELSSVLDSINGLFCAYDTWGRIVYMNKKLKALVGYPDEVLSDMKISELAIDRFKSVVEKSVRTRLLKGKEGEYEIPILASDGKQYIVAVKASPLYKQGKIIGGIMLVENITERKLAQASLRESQRLLADTIESLPDATLVIDREGKVLYWNRAIVEMTGFPAADMVGKDNYEYAIPFYGTRRPILIDMIVDPKVRFDNQYSYVKREGLALLTETHIGKLRGQDRVLWGRATPLFDTRGRVIGAIESIRDITERKMAEEELMRNNSRLEAIFSGTVDALAATTEKRDHYTAGHQHRVASLACLIAEEMGLSPNRINNIRIAGMLHDIGKLDIPFELLYKPEKLSDLEILLVQSHPEAGYDIVKSIPFEGPISDIILQHHERIKGTGYPQGLAGDKILLEAKILAVADVVEAMSSHRPYRPALGIEKALEEIQKNAGQLYDEEAVNACVKIINQGMQDAKDAKGAFCLP